MCSYFLVTSPFTTLAVFEATEQNICWSGTEQNRVKLVKHGENIQPVRTIIACRLMDSASETMKLGDECSFWAT